MMPVMKSKAFTVLEVIFVVGLLSLIVVAIAPYFHTIVASWEVKDRQLEVLQLGRVGMGEMTRTIKGATQFITANNTTFEFNDTDGNIRGFQLNGTSLEKEIGEAWDELAESVDNLTFTYYDREGNVTSALGSIRSIEIAMVISDSDGKVDPVTFSSRVTPRKDFLLDDIEYVRISGVYTGTSFSLDVGTADTNRLVVVMAADERKAGGPDEEMSASVYDGHIATQ